MDNSILTEIFADTGRDFGYESVTAEFTPFRNMKMTWIRTYKSIDIKVTDYLDDAPEDVITGLAWNLFSKITGSSDDGYPEEVSEWLGSEECIRLNLGKYLERTHALPEDHKGVCHDLQGTYENLVAKGIAKEIPNLTLRWTDVRSRHWTGSSSAVMKTVIIPTHMDSPEVPDDLFEFNLFRLLLTLEVDFTMGNPEKEKYRIERMASYPDSKRLEDAITEYRCLATGEAF